MDIGDLNFFLAVARAGGISRASKELLTVQSNISSRIRALEDELGVELFRRHARGTLTNSGERLLPYAALTTQVIEYRLDGAFVCGPVRHPDLVSEQVFIEQPVLVSGVRVADLDSVMTDGRRHRVLVLQAGCAYRARLERLFEQHGATAGWA